MTRNLRLTRARRSSRARGVTLIELLVVIAIVGVLIALLLPGVMAAREAAARMRCVANLKQIGVALQHYQSTCAVFPPGGWEWRPPRNTTRRQIAWSALILGFADQKPLFDSLNFQTGFDSASNATAAATVVEIYLCPTQPRSDHEKWSEGRAACDYGGMYGQRIFGSNNPPNGCMIYDRAFAPRHIRDGLSQTIQIGEDAGFADGQWINGLNVFDQAFAINRAPRFENDLHSEHPGGAHALFADGSARFLKESIDLRTLAALCTRAAGDIVGEY